MNNQTQTGSGRAAKTTKTPAHREIGSEFHYQPLPAVPQIPWPAPARWYGLARHAVSALIEQRAAQERALWLPAYFCHEVAEQWSAAARIMYYDDDPRRPEPDWNSLQPAPSDLVLAVNYFGVRQGEPWMHWREHTACVLIEDHSHDPLSAWAMKSRADYAFSSLRKTLPVPDSGILWSPRGLVLPPEPAEMDWTGAAMKLTAMVWKSEYLSGSEHPGLKPMFRRLQLEGEECLARTPPSVASPFSRGYLEAGMPASWREQRAANVAHLLRRMGEWREAEPLFRAWPEGHTPFAVVLQFESAERRDHFRDLLRYRDVYCPVHWLQAPNASAAAHQLAQQLLTIPADQRYTAEDMDVIAGILLGR